MAFVVSTEGGMDIEEVAHKTPRRSSSFSVDPATGIMPHHGRRVAQMLKLSGDLAKQVAAILPKLYAAFTSQGHEPAGDQSAGGDQGQAS